MSTVLVVDDEAIVRDVVVRYLEQEGFRTLQAADGDAARELLEQEEPSLVVLDRRAPDLASAISHSETAPGVPTTLPHKP